MSKYIQLQQHMPRWLCLLFAYIVSSSQESQPTEQQPCVVQHKLQSDTWQWGGGDHDCDNLVGKLVHELLDQVLQTSSPPDAYLRGIATQFLNFRRFVHGSHKVILPWGRDSAEFPWKAKRCPQREVSLAAVADGKDRKADVGDEILIRFKVVDESGVVLQDSGTGTINFLLGHDDLMPAIQNALIGMRLGENTSVTVPNSLGFGRTTIYHMELVGFNEKAQRGMEMLGWGGRRVHVPEAIPDSLVSQVFQDPKWPEAWPYKCSDFEREDESSDSNFYSEPRFVAHIDGDAIQAITAFYRAHFAQVPPGACSVLDICSSWISHYPKDLNISRVAITGMVERELMANEQATEWHMQDLNANPKLPMGDDEFDFVTNVVSVDYLSKPREVFNEIHRVLKPGGVAIMSFSNRCFPTKAIAMWVADMDDGPGHCKIVGNYFRFNPEGGWKDINSVDISPKPGRTDPMWVVTAVKA